MAELNRSIKDLIVLKVKGCGQGRLNIVCKGIFTHLF